MSLKDISSQASLLLRKERGPLLKDRLLSDALPHLVSTGVALLAGALLILGLLRPFYALPWLGETQDLIIRDSAVTGFFKLGLCLTALVCFCVFTFLLFKRKRAWHLLTQLTFLLFLLCLIYPTLLVTYDPSIIGDGAWLQQQHDTMTWLGGDIYRAHSERSIESGMGVNAQDPPVRLAVFKPPTSSLGLERLNDWIWWFGYGPSWTQFAGKGWFYTCFGFFLLTLVLIGTHWRLNVHDARRLLKKLVLLGGAFLSVYFLVVAGVYSSCKRTLNASEAHTAKGQYQEAYEKLQGAIRIVPGLVNDSGVIRQLGYFQWRLGDTQGYENTLYQAHWLEERGYHDRARDLLTELWKTSIHEMPRHCQREVGRHQLRIAINDINSGKANPALGHLERLLRREPNCIQALLHMQLANLQSNNLKEVRWANERVVSLYKGFKSRNKRGVISTSYWILSQAEAKEGNVVKSWMSRKKSKGQK